MATILYSSDNKIGRTTDSRQGIRTFPTMHPTRGTEGEGTPIRCRVAECPYSEDENGIPFDQANLWAVSTRCINVYDPNYYGPFDGAWVGNEEWWTLVPKTLPSGYTLVGRCGHITDLIADHMGYNPWLGVVDASDIRQPVYWRDADGPAPVGGNYWTPMNHNQRGDSVSLTVGVYSPTVGFALAAGPTNHIGMRGVKGTVFGVAGHTYQLIVTAEEPGDPTPTIADPPPNQVWSGTVFNGANADLDLDEMGGLFGDLGELKDYYFWLRETRPIAGSLAGTFTLYWGPRTDVPLWFTASSLNMVAPGGIVT